MALNRRTPFPLPLATTLPVVDRDPQRFELKYWVPERVIAEIREFARPYLIVDPFISRLGLTSEYNTSLYFETPGLACYRSHVDSAADRWKLRIRVYGNPPTSPAFFELKRKIKNVTVKTRTKVARSRVAALIDGSYDELPPELGAADRRHLESFLYWKTVSHAQPCVHVRAYRESYCTPEPLEDVRMTFDRQICFQPARDGSCEYDEQAWVPIDGEAQHGLSGAHTMVELKFPRIAPYWMGALAQKLELYRVGYSKYVAAVRALLDAPLLDAAELDAQPGAPPWS
jgi:hypothetical protein